jgi:hypothetical protein
VEELWKKHANIQDIAANQGRKLLLQHSIVTDPNITIAI